MTITWEEKRRRFAARNKPFESHLPALLRTIEGAFYRSYPAEMNGFVIVSLGEECVQIFEEVLLVCFHEYGNAGARLLRGLYERFVTAAFLAKFPDEIDNYRNGLNVDLGSYLHHIQNFARDMAVDLSLPEGPVQRIKEKYTETKPNVAVCEKCGHRENRPDVLKMANKVDKANRAAKILTSLYVPCFFEPTLSVHSTYYSILAGITGITNGNISFNTGPQTERATQVLKLAHDLILRVLENHNRYFNLGLDTEITDRIAEYQRIWGNPRLGDQS